jgi:hypothetical protein
LFLFFKKESASFFEKKKQKTFIRFLPSPDGPVASAGPGLML